VPPLLIKNTEITFWKLQTPNEKPAVTHKTSIIISYKHFDEFCTTANKYGNSL